MTLSAFLDFFDFEYDKDDNGYYVIDKQGANLGDIESQRFETPADVVERFRGSIYEDDYILDDLEEEFSYDGEEDILQFVKSHNVSYANIIETLYKPYTIEEG